MSAAYGNLNAQSSSATSPAQLSNSSSKTTSSKKSSKSSSSTKSLADMPSSPSSSQSPSSSSGNTNNLGGLGTLGVAASQAASLGMNQASAAWWAMAQQLAAQEYLTRLQTAAKDPTAYAALAAQGILPNYEMLSQGSKAGSKTSSTTSRSSAKTPNYSSSTQLNIPQTNSSNNMLDQLKLPSDTEIIKYTSDNGTKNSLSVNSKQRRKKESGDQNNSMLSHNSPVIPPGNYKYLPHSKSQ